MLKFMHHYEWFGLITDDVSKETMGTRLLREIGGCKVVKTKCVEIAKRLGVCASFFTPFGLF